MLRILVAEDDDLSYAVLCALLNTRFRGSVHLVRAISGKEVCSKYLSDPNNHHLIFMDVEMPDMTGIQAAEIIRKAEAGSNLKSVLIVALTAHEDDEVIEQAFRAQIDIVLRKPMRVAELEAVVRHAEQCM
jgi:CheY-like chemotaxis protein